MYEGEVKVPSLTIAFFEYMLLYVNAMFEIIALMKPVQLKESSVSEAIDTPKGEAEYNIR